MKGRGVFIAPASYSQQMKINGKERAQGSVSKGGIHKTGYRSVSVYYRSVIAFVDKLLLYW